MGINHERRQRTGLYTVPFRNLGSPTFPAYGVGLVSGFVLDADTHELVANITDISGRTDLVGLLVNGPQAVASGKRGRGYFNVGPVPALYDTSNTPAAGEPWGLKYNTADFKLYKGYGGFTIASDVTGGSGSTSRVMVVPEFRLPQRIVGHLRRSSFQITDADSGSAKILVLNSGGFSSNGNWPSDNQNNSISPDTSTGRMTITRAGMWQVDAFWSSEGPGRFSSPFQSKVHRVNLALYKNGVAVDGTTNDYYHFSLANADTTPTAGTGMPMNGSIDTALYLAAGDVIDLRCIVSEVVADSGTTTEGYISFRNANFKATYIGPQLWRDDY